MKFTVRVPARDASGNIYMQETSVENINVEQYCILAIDGSTTNSGLAIIRECDGALLYCMSAKREQSGETPVHYKIRLKRVVQDILSRNKLITQVYYEEPIIAHASSVGNLFMLRAFVEEMIIENEPTFDYIKHYEVSNMRWKKEFLAPDKVPQGTENQKKAVRVKLESYLPFLNTVSQDEIDAICLGWVASRFCREGNNGDGLQSKKKARPFKYNVQFIGADEDDHMLVELWDIYNGPEKLMEHGIGFSTIDSKTNFDKYVYNTMGNDDKVLIIKFSSKHHGNLVLQHRIGNLAAQYAYLYAVVWRVTRK